MLKDRGHKGSWKGATNNQRTKKKSYGNIHTINDRGIHEIHEMLGGVANGPNGSGPGGGGGSVSGPSMIPPSCSPATGGSSGGSSGAGSVATSPWSSPLMGRKSVVHQVNSGSGNVGATVVVGDRSGMPPAAGSSPRLMSLGPSGSIGSQ
jgi:hypothetical protein